MPDAKRPLKVPRPVLAVLAALLVWAAARHWPAVPLIYAGLTRQRPGPAAVRYLLAMRGERVPAALARGEIHAGQPVAEVIEQHGPFGVETVGRYQLLREPAPPGTIEFEGYRILARDGVLVLAGWWTCTANVTFFDTLTREEHEQVGRLLEEHRRQLVEALQAARMAVVGPAGWWGWSAWGEEQQSALPNAHMAVGGPGGYTAWYGPTTPAPE